MFTSFGGSLKDPWRGKKVCSDACAECHLTFALAEERIQTVSGTEVHKNCCKITQGVPRALTREDQEGHRNPRKGADYL